MRKSKLAKAPVGWGADGGGGAGVRLGLGNEAGR